MSKSNAPILPALIAIGGACGFAAHSVSALELGEIRVDSALGQPLRASIAYALHANEQIYDYCIFLKPVRGANGIPGVGKPRIGITDGAIVLSGQTPIREPMVAMQLAVQCPDMANLAREYTLMIDLPLPTTGVRMALAADGVPLAPAAATAAVTQEVVAALETPPAVPPVTSPKTSSNTLPVQTTRKSKSADKPTIATGARYQVQAGDSLSQIVARIKNRSIALWPAVDAIFAANPDAFLNNNRDLLKAGAWLAIPDMTGVTAADANHDVSASLPDSVAAASEVADADAALTTTEVASTAAPNAAAVAVADTTTVAIPVVPGVLPAEFAVEADDNSSLPAGAAVVVVDIPDTSVEITQAAPPVAAITSTEAGASGSWSRWLGGAGLSVLLTLLIFGRQIRDRFGSVAIGAKAVRPRRRKVAVATQPVESSVEVERNEETIQSEIDLPARPVRETILTREIPPTTAASSESYDISMTAELYARTVKDDNATVKDLQTLQQEPINDSQFSLINNFERQVFEKDYKAATAASGLPAKDLPKVNQDHNGAAEDPIDYRKSKAS